MPAQTDFSGRAGEDVLDRLHQLSIERGASDIHLSPEKEEVRLEIRVNGLLETLQPLTLAQYEQIMRKVKFIAKLKLNVTNVPQDGQYTIQVEKRSDGIVEGRERSRTVNVRVATLPSRFGEAVTLRILDPKRGIQALSTLGFPEAMAKQLQELMLLPHGLVLVTGPTGSGKTTTLYALLSSIIGTARNIITLEDPIEYEILGIIQSEIDPDHGFTFASGLRSVLRHDPNVILVGEIRDLETAQTAIDAALTGHLVLSTLHTNSAIESIPRLLSMGVSPYTFAPALRAVLAQRLVRTLVGATEALDPADPRSYDGRRALPELLTVTPAIRDLILAQEQESTIALQAAKEGFLTMKEQARLLVESKVTTREEVARVTV